MEWVKANLNLTSWDFFTPKDKAYEGSALRIVIELDKILEERFIKAVEDWSFYETIADCLDDYERTEDLSEEEYDVFLDMLEDTYKKLVASNELKVYSVVFYEASDFAMTATVTVNIDLDEVFDRYMEKHRR